VPPITFEAAPGVTAIDTMMIDRPQVTSAYLVEADEPALVETGPTNSVPAVVEGLRSIGVGPADLAHVVLTHIHLDHAGGAGALAPHFPRATIWVHERGAPHLADPTRLVSSAERIYGAEGLARMFGTVEPVPVDRLRAVGDAYRIDLGNRALTTIYTPGHASHQVCLVDSRTGGLFTGDALGVFLPDVGVLRPATPPPEFDLELAIASVGKVRAASPPMLLFSHYGPAADVEELCALAVERLERWTDVVRRAMPASPDARAVAAVLRRETADETRLAEERGADVERYEFLSSYEMNAAGILRYLEKRAERVP
jgi:glyoxylase-like metal-dependent hydrolase (beta-lactamase superfamily II)